MDCLIEIHQLIKLEFRFIQKFKKPDYENRYTYLNYQDSDKKVRDLSAYSDDDDIDSAKWFHTVSIF